MLRSGSAAAAGALMVRTVRLPRFVFARKVRCEEKSRTADDAEFSYSRQPFPAGALFGSVSNTNGTEQPSGTKAALSAPNCNCHLCCHTRWARTTLFTASHAVATTALFIFRFRHCFRYGMIASHFPTTCVQVPPSSTITDFLLAFWVCLGSTRLAVQSSSQIVSLNAQPKTLFPLETWAL
jgi:hypothetical protein